MIAAIGCGAALLVILLAVAWMTVGRILVGDVNCDWGDCED